MFCTACAARNSLASSCCATCGAPISSVLAATDKANTGRHRTSRRPHRVVRAVIAPPRRQTLFRRALFALPVVAVLIASSVFVDSTLARQRVLAAAYQRAEAAVAAGDYLTAIDGYTDAAGYRDAVARRADVDALLLPYRDAYDTGATALEAGDYAAAIDALLPVVRDLPSYDNAVFLLERARSGRSEELLQTIDRATVEADWLAVELALREMVTADPTDVERAKHFLPVQRDHAPLVLARDGALYLVGPDGGDERLVIDGVGAAWPSWSPNRTRIAFVSTDGSGSGVGGNLFVVDGNGANLELVATDVRTDVAPSWSPDGRRIAFASGTLEFGNSTRSNVVTRSIRYVDLDTGGVIDVTNGQILNPISPSWSPSGDRLAFVSRLMGEPTTVNPQYPLGAVFVASLATGEITQVAPERLFGARRVTWAPASDHLLVFTRSSTTTMGGNEGISLVNLQTGQRQFLFSTALDTSTPVWSPDGREFAFIVDGRTLRIEALNGGSRTFDLGTGGGRALIWSPDARSVVVLGTWYGASSTVVPVTGDSINPDSRQVGFEFDMDRRFSGAPQWAPLTRASLPSPPSFGGTAGDPGR